MHLTQQGKLTWYLFSSSIFPFPFADGYAMFSLIIVFFIFTFAW